MSIQKWRWIHTITTVSVSKFGENQGWRSVVEKQYKNNGIFVWSKTTTWQSNELIFESLGKIVAQITNANLYDALGKSMLIRCVGAAKMDSLSKSNLCFFSVSLVPVSYFLIKKNISLLLPSITYYLTTNYKQKSYWT